MSDNLWAEIKKIWREIDILKSFEIPKYPAWDDLRTEPDVKGTGAKNPSFAAWINGLFTYDFDNAVVASEKEVWFNIQMPHGWKEGTPVYPHVHWVNKSAGGAGHVVRWGMEYTLANITAAFPATVTIYATTLITGGDITVINSHLKTIFSPMVMTGKKISTVISCRLFRNSSDAADTYTGTAGLLYIDWHYQVDGPGSRSELAK